MPDVENSPGLWIKSFPFPKADSNKYTRGTVLICGGAAMTGASRLAARAAQRIGAGLVTLAAPTPAIPIYAEALESVIVRPADTLAEWRELLENPKQTAILIGPGLGLGLHQAEFVLAALETKKPCVCDADALTNFADNPDDFLTKLHPHCVLTPHEGEFARLFGNRINPNDDKAMRTQKAAQIAGCTVLLKGAQTMINAPGEPLIINVNAPPWLATGGSGDVLAGLIAGLLCQNMVISWGTAAAAWLHGKIATDFGPGLIAEDIIDGIPKALKQLREES